MATYAYDDFRVTLAPRAQGDYDMRAVAADGSEHVGRFRVPFSESDLERAVLTLARFGHTRRADDADASTATSASRDVGGEGPPQLNAQELGAALAGALLRDDIGRGYESAAARAAEAGRGLRLSLSLAGAPGLLHLPWEFLYRRPRFLASQRHSPLVRHLDTGSLAPPPSIDSKVRMLGVVATPSDLRHLDVEAERRRVEQAIAKVAAMGRVELEWLDPATPRRLRQALRDDNFHIVHYVGHSAFTDDGEGVLYLESDTDERAAAVDSTALANLLSDQARLRLVVLNSCEGARTTLADPFAGVATTLIQLGVPAVVAMQFEISDRAAITFAEELYTNLIGRQDPIDAAVAEARKAVYIEVDKVEWATPVLFVRHPEVELFRFEVPAAPLPPTRPGGVESDAQPLAPAPPRRRPSRRMRLVAGAAVALLIAALAIFVGLRDGDTQQTENTAPTGPQHLDEPRPRSGYTAVQVAELSGVSHLYTVDPDDAENVTAIEEDPAVHDTQPVWDRRNNRLAFTRDILSDDLGSQIWYMVPQNGEEHPGTNPAELIVADSDQTFLHFPAWAPDGGLFYLATAGCDPGPGCGEELWRTTFRVSDAGDVFATEYRSQDVLDPFTPTVVGRGFDGVRSVAADPFDPSHVAVVDGAGLHLVDVGHDTVHAIASDSLELAAFTPDGTYLVLTDRDGSTSAFSVHDRDGNGIQVTSIAESDIDGKLADLLGRSPAGLGVVAMTPHDVEHPRELVVLLDDPSEDLPAVLAGISVDDTGIVTIIDVDDVPEQRMLGELQALAL